MTLNTYRDEARAFIDAVGSGDDELAKTVEFLKRKSAELERLLDDPARLQHQIYDVMFILFELAAHYGFDLDTEWARGRERKRIKYLGGL